MRSEGFLHSGNALRLAVASALIDSERRGLDPLDPRGGNGQTHYEDDADAILAMPEMQAIRNLIDVLEANARSIPFAQHCLSDLPDNLRDWARRERIA